MLSRFLNWDCFSLLYDFECEYLQFDVVTLAVNIMHLRSESNKFEIQGWIDDGERKLISRCQVGFSAKCAGRSDLFCFLSSMRTAEFTTSAMLQEIFFRGHCFLQNIVNSNKRQSSKMKLIFVRLKRIFVVLPLTPPNHTKVLKTSSKNMASAFKNFCSFFNWETGYRNMMLTEGYREGPYRLYLSSRRAVTNASIEKRTVVIERCHTLSRSLGHFSRFGNRWW